MEGTLKIAYDMVLKNTHISTKANMYLLIKLHEKTFLCIQSKKSLTPQIEKS